ncbi:hypothetical protein [Porphyromonas macacae]|uniref:hypothetical protein n=1 Tax=Porphyromonas macacae TaxID=28115 RepID=UPI000373C413|nr:hypothetical protein [Porphyromonas macacae]
MIALQTIFRIIINGAVSKFGFGTAPFRCVGIRKVQGAKTEAQGGAPKYVTEAKGHRQRSHLRMMAHRHLRDL